MAPPWPGNVRELRRGKDNQGQIERICAAAAWCASLADRLASLMDAALLSVAELGGRDSFFVVTDNAPCANVT